MELGGVGWELFCIGCDWLDGWTRKPLRLRLSHGLEGLRERSGGEEDQKGTRCSIRMRACDTWVLADDRGWGVAKLAGCGEIGVFSALRGIVHMKNVLRRHL